MEQIVSFLLMWSTLLCTPTDSSTFVKPLNQGIQTEQQAQGIEKPNQRPNNPNNRSTGSKDGDVIRP